MKQSHNFWFPDYDDHFPHLLDKSVANGGVARYQWLARDAAIAACDQHRICVDIGANVGLWSCDLVKSFGHVIAFEPVQQFIDCFKMNMPTANYTMHCMALGRTESFIDMNIVQGNTGHTHINPGSMGKGAIPMKTLDSFNLNNMDMIKIDVEGFEGEVLAGAFKTIKLNRPVLVVEQQNHEYQNDMIDTPAIKTLQSWGYHVVRQIKKDWILKYKGDLA